MRAQEVSSNRAPVPSCRAPKVDAAGAEGRTAILGAARWRVWGPILTKTVAFGLALLGLAGIGVAASRSPVLSEIRGAQLGVTLEAGPALEPPAARGGVASASLAPAAAPSRLEAEPARGAQAAHGVEQGSSCPKRPPAAATPEGRDTEPSSPDGSGVLADGRVVLNRANAAELTRLPGVGAKRAESIVQLRHRLGRFRRPSDLLRIKGIGPRTLERMLPWLVVDSP